MTVGVWRMDEAVGVKVSLLKSGCGRWIKVIESLREVEGLDVGCGRLREVRLLLTAVGLAAAADCG